jgi:tryptophan synthase alpha chain
MNPGINQQPASPLDALFARAGRPVLSIYLSAGYPQRDLTGPLIEAAVAAGADLIEVGMPYSDPLADGPVIQQSGAQALAQGMNMALLFEQVAEVRQRVSAPLIWMGYFNAILQFGVDAFLDACARCGINGVIVPDLPPEVYQRDFRERFRSRGVHPVFLITPQTSEARIRFIDACSEGFVYLVASASLTGRNTGIGPEQEAYLARVAGMGLRNPALAGFGIHDRASFEAACRHTRGAIVGSAFLRHIGQAADPVQAAGYFVRELRGI